MLLPLFFHLHRLLNNYRETQFASDFRLVYSNPGIAPLFIDRSLWR